jgi:hypothetical protein
MIWPLRSSAGTLGGVVTTGEIVVCEGKPAISPKLLSGLIHNGIASLFGLTEWGGVGLVQ